MKKTTYGAPGLVDWVAVIKAGAAKVRVHFSGGALTQYGVTPAEYTTSDPFIQKVIEQSAYYREKRIVTVRETDLPGANLTAKPHKLAVAPKPKSAPVGEESCDNESRPHTDPPTTSPDAPASPKVEASCLQDAQAYLQEHFGISSYKVRSYESAQKAAAEHGVQFSGARFDAIAGSESAE